MKLVVVESPAKCITIKRYLGEQYIVKASLGHIRELATSGKGGLGVDIESDFSPKYLVSKDKIAIVKELKKEMKKCDEVILATDPDREGEAIAWHLAQVLGLDEDHTKRLEFHEITHESITEAINNPRTIDKNLVSSQEARRIIDRIIGFKLSYLLNKKIKSRSGGRVQSATLKMIKDHDDEIAKFVPEEYWTIQTTISLFNQQKNISLVSDNDQEINLKNSEQAHSLLKRIPEVVKVNNVETKTKISESKEPFNTSSLQQEAFSRLGFKTNKTQMIAQQLYEGIEVEGEHVGLITYLRTDATNLSSSFVQRAKQYICERFGKEYLGNAKKMRKVGNAQLSHEAIRPTSNHRTPESLRKFLTNDQYNLYRLIYQRTLASLMSNKIDEQMNVFLKGNGIVFKLDFTRNLFKGYTAIYQDDEYKNEQFPSIDIDEQFQVIDKKTEQKFTQPPAHYSEAKIVKLMEEEGIGRPSTYATTINTLKKRKYIDDKKGILTVTEQGSLTATVLDKYFPSIVNAKYTAEMEKKLDDIESGVQSRSYILNDFYYPFITMFNDVSERMYKENKETGEKCPKCGSPLVRKEGKNGSFVACSNFPKCRYVKKEEKEKKLSVATPINEFCPECGKQLLMREKNGSCFISCAGFPKCRYTRKVTSPLQGQEEQENQVCPECGGNLVKRKGKFGYFFGCSNHPNCHYMKKIFKKKRK